MRGRSILDDVMELEGGMFEHTVATEALPGGLLLDLASAFPSLSHAWLFRVLRAVLIPADLFRIIPPLHEKITTTILCCGQEVATFPVTSGIEQGCPPHCHAFRTGAIPAGEAFLTCSVLYSARLTVFADAMALAMECIRKQLGDVLHLFAEWAEGTGLRLRVDNCIHIPTRNNAEAGAAELRR